MILLFQTNKPDGDDEEAVVLPCIDYYIYGSVNIINIWLKSFTEVKLVFLVIS